MRDGIYSVVSDETRNLYDFFFFFQAEDGIRDSSVTGVQTCALPISRFSSAATRSAMSFAASAKKRRKCSRIDRDPLARRRRLRRSEERRVGKEGRSGWSA